RVPPLRRSRCRHAAGSDRYRHSAARDGGARTEGGNVPAHSADRSREDRLGGLQLRQAALVRPGGNRRSRQSGGQQSGAGPRTDRSDDGVRRHASRNREEIAQLCIFLNTGLQGSPLQGASQMASGHILKEVKDGVATVTLNRPEKLNAFSGTMAAELYASFAEYDQDDDVRVIVVTGAGRAFSAGADLSGGGNTFDADARAERRGRPAPAIRPWNVRKPIIAAINGPAVGMGITLPMQW